MWWLLWYIYHFILYQIFLIEDFLGVVWSNHQSSFWADMVREGCQGTLDLLVPYPLRIMISVGILKIISIQCTYYLYSMDIFLWILYAPFLFYFFIYLQLGPYCSLRSICCSHTSNSVCALVQKRRFEPSPKKMLWTLLR